MCELTNINGCGGGKDGDLHYFLLSDEEIPVGGLNTEWKRRIPYKWRLDFSRVYEREVHRCVLVGGAVSELDRRRSFDEYTR